MKHEKLIAIANLLTCRELAIDPARRLPSACDHARLRMAEARAAVRYFEREDDRRSVKDERRAA
jgi:hypothetical protein